MAGGIPSARTGPALSLVPSLSVPSPLASPAAIGLAAPRDILAPASPEDMAAAAAPTLPANAGAATGGAGIDNSAILRDSYDRIDRLRGEMQGSESELRGEQGKLLWAGIGAMSFVLLSGISMYFLLSGQIKEVADRQQEVVAQLSRQADQLARHEREQERLDARIERLAERRGADRGD